MKVRGAVPYLVILSSAMLVLLIVAYEGMIEFDNGIAMYNAVYPASTNEQEIPREQLSITASQLDVSAKNNTAGSCKTVGRVQRKDDWQNVTDDIFVYSAFHDIRDEDRKVIRIFGLMTSSLYTQWLSNKTGYYCTSWTDGDEVGNEVPADIIHIGKRINCEYIPVQFDCIYDIQDTADTIAITTSLCDTRVALEIQEPSRQHGQEDKKFTVCLEGVMKHRYSNYTRFVEWVEINRLLGAEKFYVYNYSIGEGMEPYLDYYKSAGLLEVLPWSLPIEGLGHDYKSFNTLWNYGQEVVLTECIYRTMFKTKYTVLIDLDEIPVPQKATNWTSLIEDSGCPIDAPGYLFRNSFFLIESMSQIDADVNSKQMMATHTTMRADFIFDANMRSKYIVRPDTILFAHIHTVIRTVDKTRICVVNPSVGLLNHYRKVGNQENSIEDHSLYRFREKIKSRIQPILDNVNTH